jgi:hypothetical protein
VEREQKINLLGDIATEKKQFNGLFCFLNISVSNVEG